MALGEITTDALALGGGSDLNCDLIHLAADDDYQSGGTAGFQDLVRAALGKGDVEVLGIIGQDCGGFVPVYDKANDKLKLYYGDYSNSSDGPLVEAADDDYHTVVLNLLVLSR